MLPLVIVLLWAVVAGNFAGLFIGPVLSRAWKSLGTRTHKSFSIPTTPKGSAFNALPSAKVAAFVASAHPTDLVKGFGGPYLPAHIRHDSSAFNSLTSGTGVTLSSIDPLALLFLAVVGIVFGILALVKRWTSQPLETLDVTSTHEEERIFQPHSFLDNAAPSYDAFLAGILSMNRAPGVTPSVMDFNGIPKALVDGDFAALASTSFLLFGFSPPATPNKAYWTSTPVATPFRPPNGIATHRFEEAKTTGPSLTLADLGLKRNPETTGGPAVDGDSQSSGSPSKPPISSGSTTPPFLCYHDLFNNTFKESVSAGLAKTPGDFDRNPTSPSHTSTKAKFTSAPAFSTKAPSVISTRNRISLSPRAPSHKSPKLTTTSPLSPTLPLARPTMTPSHGITKTTSKSPPSAHGAIGGRKARINSPVATSRPRSVRADVVKDLKATDGSSAQLDLPPSRPMLPRFTLPPPALIKTRAGALKGSGANRTRKSLKVKFCINSSHGNHPSKPGAADPKLPISARVNYRKASNLREATRYTVLFKRDGGREGGDKSSSAYGLHGTTRAKLVVRPHARLLLGGRSTLGDPSPNRNAEQTPGPPSKRHEGARPSHFTTTSSKFPTRGPCVGSTAYEVLAIEGTATPQFPNPFQHVVPDAPTQPPKETSNPRAFLGYLRATRARSIAALHAGSYRHSPAPPSPTPAEPSKSPRRMESLKSCRFHRD